MSGHGVSSAEIELQAAMFRWLRDHWGRICTSTEWRGPDQPRAVSRIDLAPPHALTAVEPQSLEAAIRKAMERA